MDEVYFVTGGAGFIGSCFVHKARRHYNIPVINLDKLTYSGNLDNLYEFQSDAKYTFVQGDIGNFELVSYLLRQYCPTAIVHFAAESHVDRSIQSPSIFVQTNVQGTLTLLQAAFQYWINLDELRKKQFRFLHISTDEVFGSLALDEPAFTETSPYRPNSPYSASKAASDHLVRAYGETYGLPVLMTHCSNNYGPRQFPEKFIPLFICNALAHQPLPLYGKGNNMRDWLHVEDHCDAIMAVLQRGNVGASYNIGGQSEKSNTEVAHLICEDLDRIHPWVHGSYSSLITHVTDRLGHDFRYAINCTKIIRDLQWHPCHSFNEGLHETVHWYLDHPQWISRILDGSYLQPTGIYHGDKV